jgi:hypothetical protein
MKIKKELWFSDYSVSILQAKIDINDNKTYTIYLLGVTLSPPKVG